MAKKICNDRKGDDKMLHFCVSLAIGILFAGLCSFIPWGPWIATLIAFVLTFAIGIGKEIYDKRKPNGHFCVWDLVADLAGALVASSLAWLANYFTFNF